ncbi:hypothetical protein BD770DRAFT_440383 [Pilaira anomala]|nr:hypothetical protein BD770DRAFT_440383 [Pilaira anomala]
MNMFLGLITTSAVYSTFDMAFVSHVPTPEAVTYLFGNLPVYLAIAIGANICSCGRVKMDIQDVELGRVTTPSYHIDDNDSQMTLTEDKKNTKKNEMNMNPSYHYYVNILINYISYLDKRLYQEMSAFETYIIGVVSDDVTGNETFCFENWTLFSYQAPPPQQESTSRRRIEESDQIWFTDCQDSLFSILKAKVVNALRIFDEFDDTDKRFSTIAMNNVLDLSDESEKCHKCFFTNEQTEQLDSLIPGNNYVISNKFTDNIKPRLMNLENFIHSLK